MKTDMLLAYLERNNIVHEINSTGLKLGPKMVFPFGDKVKELKVSGSDLEGLLDVTGDPIYRTSVFIGRFQPFHMGHYNTLKFGLKLSSQVVVVIGSAHKARDPRNPFNEKERESMIRASFSEEENARIHFVYVMDLYYNLPLWLTQVQDKVRDYAGDDSVALLGFEKDSTSFYLKSFPQWDFLPTFSKLIINATDIREEIFDNEDFVLENQKSLHPDTIKWLSRWGKNNPQELEIILQESRFLKEYKARWAKAPYQPTFVTVDSVVIRSGHVLLVERGHNPGKGLLALPGGYLNPREDFVEGALRELAEETKIKVSKEVLEASVRCVRPFAHPDRDLRGRTITHVSLIDLGHGPLPEVKGSDDAARAFWIPLSEIPEMVEEFFGDHYAIITNLIYAF